MDSILYQIGFGALGGILSYLVFQGILSIKCLRLQGQINALERIVLSLRNTGYVSKRWKASDDLEAQVFAAQPRNNPRTSHYDNDPMAFGPEGR